MADAADTLGAWCGRRRRDTPSGKSGQTKASEEVKMRLPPQAVSPPVLPRQKAHKQETSMYRLFRRVAAEASAKQYKSSCSHTTTQQVGFVLGANSTTVHTHVALTPRSSCDTHVPLKSKHTFCMHTSQAPSPQRDCTVAQGHPQQSSPLPATKARSYQHHAQAASMVSHKQPQCRCHAPTLPVHTHNPAQTLPTGKSPP